MPNTNILDNTSFTLGSQNLYKLTIFPRKKQIEIIMELLITQVNMCEFPHTSQILQFFLPSIFNSTCFNDGGLNFCEEVINTEIGHLFEHILLEYLCLLKLEEGFNKAQYEGVTNWNWILETRGTFHILINIRSKDLKLFNSALKKTMDLINMILLQEISCSVNKKMQDFQSSKGSLTSTDVPLFNFDFKEIEP